MNVYIVKDNQLDPCPYPVVFENSKYVWYNYSGDLHSVRRCSVVYDPGSFKELYLETNCDAWKKYAFFASEELAQRYVDAVKQYGKLWKLENNVEVSEKEYERQCSYCEELKAQLARDRSALDMYRKEMLK